MLGQARLGLNWNVCEVSSYYFAHLSLSMTQKVTQMKCCPPYNELPAIGKKRNAKKVQKHVLAYGSFAILFAVLFAVFKNSSAVLFPVLAHFICRICTSLIMT